MKKGKIKEILEWRRPNSHSNISDKKNCSSKLRAM